VGIELETTLRIRKLMLLLNEKGAKNTQFAQPRLHAGTRIADTELKLSKNSEFRAC
jgi:hypothetical protein